MRSSVLLKSVLFCVLFNGAAIAGAQASNLAHEINRIGNSCEGSAPEVGMAVEEQGGAPYTVGSGLGAPTSVSDVYFTDTTKDQLNSLVASAAKGSASVNSSSCDGLMAQLATEKFTADLDAQSKVLSGGADAFTSQPNAVPLPAAAWLFSSALFGFVVVANRRKV
ncbi:VPLPA-CTERM sorting domain-containing protein [Pseudomonas sp. 14P_8.1_Bac3]|uniref:VPLPA-CTERM sorting domain-containing protein n=1 Tax=Pseudomonas sp. 14P_8.1_Bac3 TaxID=2971621 RepID=UPI0021C5B3BE|nr:VPLPA-CTERM sorting domain-containing protein [Pseudomonas sp. 14P_8.1_Bac3]MCU1761118.1 VPLPA-CTERM sorting domain-containing protein [Pseudomonas sp. 14P_8.1_Bac3]